MIRVTTIRNALAPERATTTTRAWRGGMRARDLVPDGCEGEVWVDGWHAAADARVPDGARCHVIVVPGFEAFAALAWYWKAAILLSVAGASALLSKALIGKQKDPVTDPDGSINNGFHGFRSSYTDGEAVPVIYGRHRYAAPVISQEITAYNTGADGFTNSEAIRLLLCLGEGPIQGVGAFLGAVATQAQWLSLVSGLTGDTASLAGVQINGQLASNFAGINVEWRTGELSQTPIDGVEDTVEITDLGVELVFEPDALPATNPPGTDTVGIEGTAGEFAAITTTDAYDRFRVQFYFPAGIYAISGGNPTTTTARFRVQYWSVDSGGTRTSDTVLLPEIALTGDVQGPVVYDYEAPFLSATDFIASSGLGWYRCQTQSSVDQRMFLAAPLNPVVLPDNFGSGIGIKFSCAAWMRDTNDPRRAMWLIGQNTASGVDDVSQFYDFGAVPANVGFSCYLFDATLLSTPAAPYDTGGVWLVLDVWRGPASPFGWQRWKVKVATSWAASINTTWVHAGFSYDGSQPHSSRVKFYFNGVQLSPTYTFVGSVGSSNILIFQSSPGVFIGRGPLHSSTATDYSNGIFDISSWGMWNGVKPSAHFQQLALGTDFTTGTKNGVIDGGDPDLRAGMNIKEFITGTTIENLAQPGVTTAGIAFGATVGGSALTEFPQAAGLPTTPGSIGTPNKDRHHVEVYRSNAVLDDPATGQTVCEVSKISVIADQDYEYPGMGVLSLLVVGDEQIENSRPDVSVLAYGRRVNVWDGASETFPAFIETWTRNPAWIALDVATNPRYGMGGLFPLIGGVDLGAFKAWADYCDETVEDGLGTPTFFSAETGAPGPGFPNGSATFYVGLLDDVGDPTGNSIPKSWVVGASVAVKTADSNDNPGAAQAWVTAALGLGCEITSIDYQSDSLAPDGYTFWLRLVCVWPEGVAQPEVEGTSVFGTLVGVEPRCRYDAVHDEKGADGWGELLAVFQAGRAMPTMVGRKLSVFIDRKRDPVALVTMGNVVEGSFRMAWTGVAQRPNSYEVDFLDELSNYDRVTVERDHPSLVDPSTFATFRRERLQMRGVVRRSQVIRDADFRLRQLNELLRTCEFRLGLDGLPLAPGDRVLVQHDVPSYGVGGRVLDYTSGLLNVAPGSDDVAGELIDFGGQAGTEHPTTNVGGYPLLGAPSALYQTTGPFGYGTAALVSGGKLGQVGTDGSGVWLLPGDTPEYQLNADGLQAVSPVDTISGADYQVTVSVFVKEPDKGAGEYLRFGFRAWATSADPELYVATFRWVAGALELVAASETGGVTAEVQAPGVTGADAGWYRAVVMWRLSDSPGAPFEAGVGDGIGVVVQTNYHPTDGEWTDAAASEGRGVNFLQCGDPFDLVSAISGGPGTGAGFWPNSGVSLALGGESILHPFYEDSASNAVTLVTCTIANGLLAGVQQTRAIVGAGTTFNGDGVIAGEFFTATLYLRNDDATTTYVALTSGTDLSSVAIDWATHVATPAGSGGYSTSFEPVRQTSTADDADWWRLDLVLEKAHASTNLTLLIQPEAVGAGATGKGIYVASARLHGRSSTDATTSDYPHRGMYIGGIQVQPGVYSATPYPEALPAITLDRDVTLEEGNTYEVRVRATSVAGAQGQATEVVPVYGGEVPAVGSEVFAAGTPIRLEREFLGFTPRPEDLYAFGTVGNATNDFAVVSITQSAETLERTVRCVEYLDAIYDETPAALPVSSFTSDSTEPVSGGPADLGMGLLGGAPVTATEATHSTDGGATVIAADVSWGWLDSGSAGTGGVRLWVAPVASEEPWDDPGEAMLVAGSARMVAVAEGRSRRARIDGYPFRPGATYRIYVQPHGPRGRARHVRACPWVDFIPWGSTLQPPAPSVDVRTRRGERALVKVTPRADEYGRRPEQVEVRVGGWLAGQVVTTLGAGQHELTDEMFSGPTNSAGWGTPTIYARGRMPGNLFTQAATFDMGSDLPDGAEVIADYSFEEDWTDGGGGVLSSLTTSAPFDPTNPYMLLAFTGGATTATWTSATRDITHARRVYVEPWVEACYSTMTTLADMEGETLGNRRMAHWTLEGPISGPERVQGAIRVQWAHSTTGTPGSSYVDLRPGIAHFRSAKFRIAVRREAGHDVRIRRFGVRVIELPAYRADGGTF